MDERTLELIHGDIDGEIGPDERRELELLLQASPEARREHEKLGELNLMLGSLGKAEPPAGLRDTIIAAARRPAKPIRNAPARRGGWGIVAAMAATVAGVALFLGRSPELTEFDPSALGGTLGRPATDAGVPTFRLDGQIVSGAIMLHHSGSGLALEVDLEAERPVEVVAAAAGARLELSGFVRLAGMPAKMATVDGQLRLLHKGNQHYALVLTNKGAAASAIDVSVYDGENLIGEGRLTLAAEPASTGN
jgi:anti-sigma factor RsiW